MRQRQTDRVRDRETGTQGKRQTDRPGRQGHRERQVKKKTDNQRGSEKKSLFNIVNLGKYCPGKSLSKFHQR